MKKTILATALALSFNAMADVAIIDGTLGANGKSSSAMDKYSVSCVGNATHIVATVKDWEPVKNSVIAVQIQRDVDLTTPKLDKVDGDNFYSPQAIMEFSDYGPYTVIVSKTEADGTVNNFGVEKYRLRVACYENGKESFYPMFDQTQDQ